MKLFTKYMFGLCAIAAFATTIVSCSDDLGTALSSTNNKEISFHVSANTSWTTEGTRVVASQGMDKPEIINLEGRKRTIPLRVSSMDYQNLKNQDDILGMEKTRVGSVTTETFYDAFGLLGYMYDGTFSNSNTPNLTYNKKMERNSNVFSASNLYWPSTAKTRFYAYAPYGNSNIMLSSSTKGGAPTIDYTVPATASNQVDLLVASTGDIDRDDYQDYALTFNHALTAVKFAVGNLKEGTITEIKISGVYGTGTFDYASNSWTLAGSNSASYSIYPNYVTDGINTNVVISNNETTMMLMPQSLTSNAKVSVTFSFNDGTSQTLTSSIGSNGETWGKGQTVIYTISSTSLNEIFLVTPPDAFTYKGGKGSMYVSSTKYTGSGIANNLGWSAKFYDTTSGVEVSQPSWLSSFTTSGNGGLNNIYNVTTNAQTNFEYKGHTSILRSASVKGTASAPYDLSVHDYNGQTSMMNTANCYVVNSPGIYKIPLVYGNAIKNGSKNESSYKSSVTGNANVLTNFVNHLDVAITDPYIYNNTNCNPNNACIVWQDANNLVSNVKLSTDKRFLEFTVSKDDIMQGNSVVAVRDVNDIILWSWHIWVTDESVTTYRTIKGGSGKSYKFFPLNIGWCSTGDDVKYFGARNVKVVFTQQSTGKTASFIVYQDHGTESNSGFDGRNPYFQFGRKDPVIPGTGSGTNGDHAIYNNTYAYQNTNKAASFGEGIQTPYCYYTVSTGPWTSSIQTYNLWNVNNTQVDRTSANVIKTVYDPSPVGFHIPNTDAFEGLSGSGGVYNTTQLGWTFPTSDGGHIIFILSGYRRFSAAAFSTQGHYWTECPHSPTVACDLQLTSSSLGIATTRWMDDANAIRVVAE